MLELIHIAGITQAFFLGILYWQRRDRIQALLLLVTGAGIVFGYLYGSRRILEWPHLARFGFTTAALLGPLFYFSIRARITGRPLRPAHLALFIVPLGIFLYLLPFHFSSAEAKLEYLREDLVQIHFDCIVILHVSLFNNLVALLLALRLLNNEGEQWIKSHTDAGQARKLMRRNHLYTAAFMAIPLAVAAVSWWEPQYLYNNLFPAVYSVIVLVHAYAVLYVQQSGGADIDYPTLFKYRKSEIDDGRVRELGQRIATIMVGERPFLDPDFSLGDLAARLETSPHQTSQILNRHFQKSFARLVREYRVSAAMEMLVSPAAPSVLRAALDSGYNSKSAFNKAFKEVAGMTPTQWLADRRRATTA